jgi:methylenetetrahydrofolate dehydrogenase (NADP+)/methenyltetrahydrofolate cyclohydrolase
MTERLEGKPVAEAIRQRTRTRIEAGLAQGWRKPQLVSVHLGLPTPYYFYLKNQERAATQAGIEFRSEALPAGSGQVELEARLAALEADPAVDGVIVEHPLPAPFDFSQALSRLSPAKDVDGVGWVNLGRLVSGTAVQVPAVDLAGMAIAEHYHIPVSGRRVAVLGRSTTVGLPLALLLLAKGARGDATVLIGHSRTPNLAQALEHTELIMTCVGKPGLLNRSNVPKGAAIIDVGLSSVPDPTKPGGVRAVGDADAADLEGWASALTPVPGGVGPVTVAELMSNALHAWELAHATRSR